jgi:hypothetical protein
VLMATMAVQNAIMTMPTIPSTMVPTNSVVPIGWKWAAVAIDVTIKVMDAHATAYRSALFGSMAAFF